MNWRVVYQAWWGVRGEVRVRDANINVLYAGDYSKANRAFRDAVKISFGELEAYEIPSRFVDGNRSFEQHRQHETGNKVFHTVISLEPDEFDGNPLGI